jgi:DMSO/TMAO reductase YedYZ molybdopterin-dependent catalytic subunit
MNRYQFLRITLVTFLAFCLVPIKALADMVPKVFRRRDNTLPITPTHEFYVEDYSGPPKSLKKGLGDWKLSISGKVDHPLVLSYDDLLARSSVKRFITLSCIGNPVGGRAIDNAEWEGIPLSALLEEADPHFFANTLNLQAEDGYYENLPLKSGSHPGALLAYKMNGKPLTLDHGFPVRLLVPGLYGIKQMKWLREITVSNKATQGYWHKKGWSKKAKVKIYSRIDTPLDQQVLTNRSAIFRGIAFAGDRGIEYVQLSIDGEKTWSLATLQTPMSRWSWVFWSFPCKFPRKGLYRVAVRAVDKYSGLQRDDLRDPFPSGTSGIHRIEIRVG